MQTVRDLYNDSFGKDTLYNDSFGTDYDQPLLREIIELLVNEKKVLKWDDSIQYMFEKFLTAHSEEQKERLNRRYRECLEELRNKRSG